MATHDLIKITLWLRAEEIVALRQLLSREAPNEVWGLVLGEYIAVAAEAEVC